MGKYKVGDRVRLRSDLKGDNKYGSLYCPKDMLGELCGCELVVVNVDIDDCSYRVDRVDGVETVVKWWATDEMLEPVDAPGTNVKVGDKVRLKMPPEGDADCEHWVSNMEKYVGREATVLEVHGCGACFVDADNEDWMWWPGMFELVNVPDTNVGNKDNYDDKIIGIMRRQTEKGMEKYGVPLNENTTLTATQRIEHYQEEMIDGLRYAEHLKKCLEDNLTVNDYQRAAMRTANPECHDLSNVGLGLSGETGEVTDIIKKHLHQGHNLDKEHLVEELGDVAWYLALAADTIGVSLEEILTRNIEKLKCRYPDGFDKERSIHREEKK